MNTRLLRFLVLSFLVSAGIGGCGGGGGGTAEAPAPGPAPAASLSGTAAAGAPIIGTVSVKDSAGAVKTVVIAPNGTFSVDVLGMTAPFLLRAEGVVGTRSFAVHSAATAADVNGIVNVTPLTDLIVANAAAEVASAIYSRGEFASLTADALAQAMADLRTRLLPVLLAVGLDATTDLIRATFNADHTGQDALLDVLRVTVDPATAQATILNIVNNQQIVDDLTAQADLSVLSGEGVAAGLTDVQQIVALFDAFSALFETSLPSPTRPALLALFDADFLNGGDSLEVALNDITQNAQFIGVKFDNVTLRSLSAAAAEVDFRVRQATGNEFTVSSWTVKKSGGTWRLAGDQRIAYVEVGVGAWNRVPTSVNAGITTGLTLSVDRGSDSPAIHYAVVTGPGLPTTGGGRDGASAGVLLVQFGNGDLNLASGRYQGQSTPRMTFGAITLYGNALPLADGRISAIPDNAVYTITLYADPNSTPDNLADDALLATYTSVVPKRPYLSGELSAASFPGIDTTFNQLAAFATGGGSLDVSWTLPAGLKSSEIRVARCCDNYESTEKELDAGATRATLVWLAPPMAVSLFSLEVTARDTFGRELQTVLGNFDWM